MKFGLRKIYKKYFAPHALVLMYHRVTEPDHDVWEIAVSPANFEQHLQVLKKTRNVVSIEELTDNIRAKKLRRNSIVITFDDGYADNYNVARPLLEKYELPATFFVSSALIDKEEGFWWDELAEVILKTPVLPPTLPGNLSSDGATFDLQDEACLSESQRKANNAWLACSEPPPTLRCTLYYQLWQQLKPIPSEKQKEQLQEIKSWAKYELNVPENNKCMSSQQLRELSQNSLFTIGAHTVTHPSLSCHSKLYQKQEILANKEYLEQVTGKNINLLAYPYGDYNQDTLTAVSETGFKAAFTTEEKAVTSQSSIFKMSRFQVTNLSAQEFEHSLKQWKQIN